MPNFKALEGWTKTPMKETVAEADLELPSQGSEAFVGVVLNLRAVKVRPASFTSRFAVA
jgi:hypothetical protein